MGDGVRKQEADCKKPGYTTRLGQEIRLMRIRRGYTRDYVASLMDTSASTLYVWEQKGVCPRPGKYRQLAAFLEISLETLIQYMKEPVQTAWTASDDGKEQAHHG